MRRGIFHCNVQPLVRSLPPGVRPITSMLDVNLQQTWENPEILGSVKPLLFVVGKNDQAVPLDLSLRQIAVPRYSSALLLDKVGHMGMFESEQKCYSFINSFIQNQS